MLLESHFISGIGFYCNLLSSVAQSNGLSNLAFPNMMPKREVLIIRETMTPESTQRIQRLCINVGDLYRYLNDLGRFESRKEAECWYTYAHLWGPSLGMPFNQLGTLSNAVNYGLDSVYFYVRW